MLGFKVRNASKDESPYLYRLSIVCFGKTIEMGVSYDNLASMKSKGNAVLSKGEALMSRIQFNGRTQKKKGPKSKDQVKARDNAAHREARQA